MSRAGALSAPITGAWWVDVASLREGVGRAPKKAICKRGGWASTVQLTVSAAHEGAGHSWRAAAHACYSDVCRWVGNRSRRGSASRSRRRRTRTSEAEQEARDGRAAEEWRLAMGRQPCDVRDVASRPIDRYTANGSGCEGYLLCSARSARPAKLPVPETGCGWTGVGAR
jgi:hypothetical protein